MKKISKFLHHLIFGTIAFFSFASVQAAIGTSGSDMTFAAYFNVSPFLVFLISMSIYLLAAGKIITYKYRKTLKGTNVLFWQKKYILRTACAFAVLLACCAFYYLVQDTVFLVLDEQGSVVHTEDPTASLAIAANMYILLLGPFFLWMIFLKNMILDQDRDWRRTITTFVRTDVSVYLVFRVAVFLLCLGGSLLMGLRSSDVQNSYFLFMMDDEQVQSLATGSLTGGGSFFSGITGAASFYVLITMAEELLSGKTRQEPREQLRRMFLERDTVKLMLMTLVSIAAGFLSYGGRQTLFSFLVDTVLILLWAISALLFLADTAMLPYLIIYTTLGFIERILPLPEVTGFLVLSYPLIMIARILLFSVVSVMIADHQRNQKREISQNYQAAGVLPTIFSCVIWSATFLDALCLLLRFADRSSSSREDSSAGSDEEDLLFIVALAKVGNDFIDQWIDKITQALDTKLRQH